MSNLDDFFKKRDKKKKVAKSKFSTVDTDEFAKRLEATTIDDDQQQQEGLITSSSGTGINTETTTTTTTTTTILTDNLTPTQKQTDTFNDDNNDINSGGDNEIQDEEWKPFDTDDNKDYSGLRIKIEHWKEDDEDYDLNNANDDSVKKPACPWGSKGPKITSTTNNEDSNNSNNNDQDNNNLESNKTEEIKKDTPTTTTTPIEVEAPTKGAYIPPALRRQKDVEMAKTVEPTPAPVSSSGGGGGGGKYIPPSMRKAALGGDSTSSSSSSYSIPSSSVNFKRPNKAQPNIMDTMEFPTLDATDDKPAAPLTNGNNEKFDMIKKGGRVEPKAKDSSIDLANKFTALSSEN